MLARSIPLIGVLIGVTGFAGVLRTPAFTPDVAAPIAASVSTGSLPIAQSTDNMTRIENGLTSNNRTITSRMATHRITGLSLVIVENNAIRWRRGYGRRIAGDASSTVSSTTTFDAASVSKPVAAAAALRLVDQGRVSLTDTKILSTVAPKYMTPAQVGIFVNQFANLGDIDLNRLLSHCAGVLSQTQVSNLSATGAQSFSLSSTLPTLGRQLLGNSPAAANFKPVQTTALRPGAKFQYSGASYMLVEAVIDRFSTEGFSSYTTQLFRDLEMTSSTFADFPLLSMVSAYRTNNRFARGHLGGSTQAGRNYANHAAASLITTTDDLARFLIMVNQNGTYGGKRILTSTSVQALTAQSANSRCSNRTVGGTVIMGLGMRSNGSGTRFHRGTHNGYRAYIFARPGDRWAMAVLMTGAPGDADNFAPELFRAVEGVYGFPGGTLVR